ncbi:hypothetical protein BGZ52_003168 [Haplosporangium bisporale]|nr:hypothetical protein BGZ52_003168 [Haplosporangium bisporale]KAF9214569.1 hypothetical protein BGZ59_003421 [Podila verticillata]
MKEIKASITIAASPSEVWQTLTDFDQYPDWNPMLTLVKGKFAACSWSPMVIKSEPGACLEWSAPYSGIKGCLNGTHYFQLTSSHGGTQTEFTQGKKYHGWGTSLYSVAGSIEGARRGLVAMNSALSVETVRRKQLPSKSTIVEKATTVNEKAMKDSDSEMVDLAVVDLDISDSAAVAVATADSSFEPSEEPEPTCASPKPEKRTSIIGAGISSLFGVVSKPSMPSSSSRDDLINPAIAEETEDGDEGEEGEDEDGDDDGEDGFELPPEDPEAKRQREAKNAERIELDLGGGELSMADFGF